RMGGVLDLSPGLAGLFLVAALSLAGMPPFSGFLSKFVLTLAALVGGNYVVVTAAILTGFLTLYSMTKIWLYTYWRARCREHPLASFRPLLAPVAALVVLSVLMGVCAQPVLGLATRAADSLTNPTEYIRVVLGPAGAVPTQAIREAGIAVAQAWEAAR
ncbi:MAG: mnhD, partial [candidate division NC10 bacterium]|nr:mnhD [candidate division NC10 bacterium]